MVPLTLNSILEEGLHGESQVVHFNVYQTQMIIPAPDLGLISRAAWANSGVNYAERGIEWRLRLYRWMFVVRFEHSRNTERSRGVDETSN